MDTMPATVLSPSSVLTRGEERQGLMRINLLYLLSLIATVIVALVFSSGVMPYTVLYVAAYH